MNDFNIFVSKKDLNLHKYIIATYFLESKSNLKNAAWELAIGQSVGNPKVRSQWETTELFNNHSCFVLEPNVALLEQKKSGTVEIAFPLSNIDLTTDGVSQLLCQLMGGQMDIDDIIQCHLEDIQFPDHVKPDISTPLPYRHQSIFKGPKFGISGIREYTKCYYKPLLGGIIKPKVVNSTDMLVNMVKEMVDGGVNFIKEDEIMANPAACPLEKRIEKIAKLIDSTNVIYAFCINGDSPHLLDRVKSVYAGGGNAIHVNFWSGLGAYKAIRDLDLPLFVHFQKSGDKILTNKSHAFRIDWKVICELAGLMGADFIHAGMWGGYLTDDELELKKVMNILHNRGTLPALSCGMHAGLIEAINDRFGIDYMANVGGALHGHPMGTEAGVRAIRQSIDKSYGPEYWAAIQKWGLVK